jgi:hypothetical protein
MYDPWVVHTFERVYEQLDAEVAKSLQQAAPQPIELPAPKAKEPHEERGDTVATGKLIALECEALLVRLRPILSATVAVFFHYDAVTDAIVAHHVTPGNGPNVNGFRIARGDKLSGWVAANRQTIVNSDAALDLGDMVNEFSPKLAYCLSVAVTWSSQLIGVISLYAPDPFPAEAEATCRGMVNDILESLDGLESTVEPALALRIAR